MPLRQYLALLILSAGFSWGMWLWVFYYFQPEGGMMHRALFFVTLFFSVFLTGFLLNFALRLINFYKKNKILGKELNLSFQQSLAFSLLLLVILILQSWRVLTWWNLLLLLAAVIIWQLLLRFSRNFN
jgi:hypothetical protein